MTTPQVTDMTGARFYKMQDPNDAEPYAVAALATSGLPMRWVPGYGWLDWPDYAGALFGFIHSEAREAKEITWEEASALIVTGIGQLPAYYVETHRGMPDGNPNAEPLDPDDNPRFTKRSVGPTPPAPESDK